MLSVSLGSSQPQHGENVKCYQEIIFLRFWQKLFSKMSIYIHICPAGGGPIGPNVVRALVRSFTLFKIGVLLRRICSATYFGVYSSKMHIATISSAC